MNRNHRSTIAKQTLDIIEQGFYLAASGTHIDIKVQIEHANVTSRLYRPGGFTRLLEQFSNNEQISATHYKVVNTTTLEAAHDLLNMTHEQVTCLNFASAKNPGGGFLNGSQAQEESLARSTTLYPTLLKNEDYYKSNRTCSTSLYTNHMIYSPNVVVIRTAEGELLEVPYLINIITSPAVNAGAVKNNEPNQVKRIQPVMQQRMKNFLTLCAHNKCENLILGAWGCGVFMNNPEVVANMWYELLMDTELFKNRFRNITFAVLDRKDCGTYSVFKQRFQQVLSKVNTDEQ